MSRIINDKKKILTVEQYFSTELADLSHDSASWLWLVECVESYFQYFVLISSSRSSVPGHLVSQLDLITDLSHKQGVLPTNPCWSCEMVF